MNEINLNLPKSTPEVATFIDGYLKKTVSQEKKIKILSRLYENPRNHRISTVISERFNYGDFHYKNGEDVAIKISIPYYSTFPYSEKKIIEKKENAQTVFPEGSFDDFLNVYGYTRLFLQYSASERLYFLTNVMGFVDEISIVGNDLRLTYNFINEESRIEIFLNNTGNITEILCIRKNETIAHAVDDDKYVLPIIFGYVYRDLNHVNLIPDKSGLSNKQCRYLEHIVSFDLIKQIALDSLRPEKIHNFLKSYQANGEFPSALLRVHFDTDYGKKLDSESTKVINLEDALAELNTPPQNSLFIKGLMFLKKSQFGAASEYFSRITPIDSDYKRAQYNLMFFHAEGVFDVFDIDKSAELLKYTASLGHKMAEYFVPFLELADRAEYGTNDLKTMGINYYSAENDFPNLVVPIFNLLACRTYAAIAFKYDIADEFVACCFSEILEHDYGPYKTLILELSQLNPAVYTPENTRKLIASDDNVRGLFSFWLDLWDSLSKVVDSDDTFYCQMVSIPWYIHCRTHKGVTKLPGMFSGLWGGEFKFTPKNSDEGQFEEDINSNQHNAVQNLEPSPCFEDLISSYGIEKICDALALFIVNPYINLLINEDSVIASYAVEKFILKNLYYLYSIDEEENLRSQSAIFKTFYEESIKVHKDAFIAGANQQDDLGIDHFNQLKSGPEERLMNVLNAVRSKTENEKLVLDIHTLIIKIILNMYSKRFFAPKNIDRREMRISPGERMFPITNSICVSKYTGEESSKVVDGHLKYNEKYSYAEHGKYLGYTINGVTLGEMKEVYTKYLFEYTSYATLFKLIKDALEIEAFELLVLPEKHPRYILDCTR